VGEKAAIDKALAEVGQVLSRSDGHAPLNEISTDRIVGYRLTLQNVASVKPRETITLTVEVNNVDKKAKDLTELVRSSKGLIGPARVQHHANGLATATLNFDVPYATHQALVETFKSAGQTRQEQSSQNPQVPENELATAHIELTLVGQAGIVPSDEGLWPQIRTSLYYSFRVFGWSIMLVILGLCVVLPWALVIWVVWKVISRMWRKPQVSV
jgi:hypothetical protein